MARDFIDDLPFPSAAKDKIRSLAVDSPEALLGLLSASSQTFEVFFGIEETAKLIAELLKLVPEEEIPGATPTAPQFPLGAVPLPAPKLEPRLDVALRARLYNEWKMLQDDPSTRNSQRAQHLERRIREL